MGCISLLSLRRILFDSLIFNYANISIKAKCADQIETFGDSKDSLSDKEYIFLIGTK